MEKEGRVDWDKKRSGWSGERKMERGVRDGKV
jgi:hypothetical protein